MLTRRGFLTAGGLALVGLAGAADRGQRPGRDPHDVRPPRHEGVVRSDRAPHRARSDGSLGRPVQRAYDDGVSPPDRAEPWDSHFLVNPGSHFEVTLTIPGVYDYFCMPHEVAGMVGRIVVGRPEGPGALRFDYFTGRSGTAEWKPVPPAAQKALPSVSAIMRQRVIRRGRGTGGRSWNSKSETRFRRAPSLQLQVRGQPRPAPGEPTPIPIFPRHSHVDST